MVASNARSAGNAHKAVGRYGEQVAVRHLVAQGFQVLDQNWRCDLGEIDIVARDGDCLVVCEVKTRQSLVCGEPVEAVTWRKAARLRQLTFRWLAESGLRPPQVRIDVVLVMRSSRGPAQVEHLRAVA